MTGIGLAVAAGGHGLQLADPLQPRADRQADAFAFELLTFLSMGRALQASGRKASQKATRTPPQEEWASALPPPTTLGSGSNPLPPLATASCWQSGQSLTMENNLGSWRFDRLKPHRVRKTRYAQYAELTMSTCKADGAVDRAIYVAAAAGIPEICKATSSMPSPSPDARSACAACREPAARRRHAREA